MHISYWYLLIILFPILISHSTILFFILINLYLIDS